MKSKILSKSAFTLIEGILVAGIILLVTILSVTGLSYSRKQKQVKTSAESLRNLLIEARSLALASKEDVYNLDKIQIRIYASDPSKKIEIYQILIDGTAAKIEKQIELPSSITFEAADGNLKYNPTDNYYYFSFLARNLPAPAPPADIDLNQIGQVTDSLNSVQPITINVSDGSNTWQVLVELYTGSVEAQKL